MNKKLISNNVKDVIEEIISPDKKKREFLRSARYFSNLSYLELASSLRRKEIDLVLDVGANSGQFYTYLRREVGYKGRVFSFEPNPEMVTMLAELKKADPALEVFPFALGSAHGSLSFNIYEDSKLSSFLQGDDTGSERFKDKFKKGRVLEVPVKTLDSFFETLPDRTAARSVFLKLDTQGFDLEVFKGARACKPLIQFVQSELSVIPLYRNMPHYTESINFFESEGYKLISLIPVTRDKSQGYVIEFDALWGRQS